MKLCFCDTETTGVRYKDKIWQLTSLISSGDRRDFKDIYIDRSTADWEPKAKEMMLKSIEGKDISWETPYWAHHEFASYLSKHVDKFNKNDKLYFIAFNSPFDDRMLREFFKENGDKFYGSFFHWPAIDVAGLAALHLREKRSSMPNFKLDTVAKIIGIEVDDSRLHDAIYDLELLEKVYNIVVPKEILK